MYTYQLVIEVMSYDQNFLIGPEDNHEIEEIKLEMKKRQMCVKNLPRIQ